MTETTNFGLKKPEETDFYSVDTQNDNMDAIDRVLQGFKDGTQQVGDSAKLGDKDASEYALEEELTKRHLTYKSATTQDALLTILNDYSANFADGTAYEFYVNVRFSGYQLGSGVWHIEGVKTNSNSETQRASLFNGDVKLRGKFDGAWLDWEEIATIADLANYLPLSGGTVAGKNDSPLIVKNTVGANAYVGLEDKDGNKNYIGFENGVAHVYGKGHILHTGNKPSGTYTGNGSATERQIAISGIGSTLMIRSEKGMVIITYSGGIGKKVNGTSVDSISPSEGRFQEGDGYMRLRTTNELLNASGVTYSYEFL